MVPRSIKFYKNYFLDFYCSLEIKLQNKIDTILELVVNVENIPAKYFCHIENKAGLYEIRVEYRSNIYRIFCCFDKGNLIILFNGFQKKTQKTPKEELDKAEKLMQEYFSKN